MAGESDNTNVRDAMSAFTISYGIYREYGEGFALSECGVVVSLTNGHKDTIRRRMKCKSYADAESYLRRFHEKYVQIVEKLPELSEAQQEKLQRLLKQDQK